jgi:hypothetical protein
MCGSQAFEGKQTDADGRLDLLSCLINWYISTRSKQVNNILSASHSEVNPSRQAKGAPSLRCPGTRDRVIAATRHTANNNIIELERHID